MKHALQIYLPSLLILVLLANPANAGFDWTAHDSKNLKEAIDTGVYGTVTSVLIIHQGQTVFEHYAHGSNEGTLHNTRSVTKTLTGMAVGTAVRDGKLDIRTPIAQYFADLTPFNNPDNRKLQITAEDLLTMSSPMECDDFNQFSRGNEERMYVVEDWPSFYWDLPIRGFPSWAIKSQDDPYSRTFSYCTAGVQLLGELVERAVEQPFTQYVEKEIFEPLGIRSFNWARNGNGVAHLGGGTELTTRGLGKLAELQRNGGKINGQTLLTEAWTISSIKPHVTVPNQPGQRLYGYLWWLRHYPIGENRTLAAAMNGNGGNRVLVLKEFDMTVVITKTDYNSNDMHAKTDAFINDEIIAHLFEE